MKPLTKQVLWSNVSIFKMSIVYSFFLKNILILSLFSFILDISLNEMRFIYFVMPSF